jgi:RNA polymerase sigma-70 factor (ECF subfamily)
MMQESTSITLLEQLNSTDESERSTAWHRFVHLYTPLLLHWAGKQGFQPADANDLVQEVLIKLTSRLSEYERREGASFRGWLMILLRNLAHDYRRRKATRRLDPSKMDRSQEVHQQAHPAVELEESEYRQWLIRRGLDSIRDDFSQATWKAFDGLMFDGKSPRELAEELGLSINAIYMARHRVLARLREVLNGFLDDV